MSSIEVRGTPSTVGRAFVSAGLVVAMCLFGFGVYYAASLPKNAKTQVQRPTDAGAPVLAGRIYVEQGGAIYRFDRGSFRRVTAEEGWMQPAVSPDGSQLVAVKRSLNRSDLYVLGSTGRVPLPLTHNQSQSVEGNHWVFYPRFSPDASTVYFSYDPKDPYNNYRVDLAIFSMSADHQSSTAVPWTQPNDYTGGDVDPVPLQRGGLIYTKFSIDEQSVVHSQVWFQAAPGIGGAGLTKPADDCGQAALSKDETMVAMVCRHGGLESADLEVATLDGSTPALGEPVVVVHSRLVASPAFSPDGKLLAYLAPAEPSGPFQLWTVAPNAASAAAPRQITTHLDLDPSSAPAWTVS
jgi:WD40 repeat protein